MSLSIVDDTKVNQILAYNKNQLSVTAMPGKGSKINNNNRVKDNLDIDIP